MKAFVLFLALVPMASFGQSKADSLWRPFQPLVGVWTGSGESDFGKGQYQMSVQFILNNRYVEIKNRTVYPPTDKKPKEEIHEDRSIISYDKARKTFVLRQFHIEGFVNQYVLESISPDRKTLVFVTEAIENIPKGWRARETFQVTDNDHWKENFELAEPSKEFAPYTKAEFTRSK